MNVPRTLTIAVMTVSILLVVMCVIVTSVISLMTHYWNVLVSTFDIDS